MPDKRALRGANYANAGRCIAPSTMAGDGGVTQDGDNCPGSKLAALVGIALIWSIASTARL